TPTQARSAQSPSMPTMDEWNGTTRLAFSPDGALLVGAVNRWSTDKSNRDAIRVWDARTGKAIRLTAARVGRAPFLSDGTLLAADFDGAAFLLNAREAKIVRQVVPPIAEKKRPFAYDGPGPPLLLPGGKT